MFTYDETLPDALSRIRFELGDTDAEEPLLQDETILAQLATHNDNEIVVLSKLARGLYAKFSRMPDRIKRDDGMEVFWTTRLKGWVALMSAVQEDARASTGRPAGMMVKRPGRGGVTHGEYRARNRVW